MSSLAIVLAGASVLATGCRLPVAPGATLPAETTNRPDSGDGPPPRTEPISIVVDGITRHIIVHLPGGATTHRGPWC